MSKPKLKESPKESRKKGLGKLPAGSAGPGKPGDLEYAQLAEVWKQEIENLGKVEFSSSEEAIAAIAQSVVRRLGADSETEAFIRLMIETDPQLEERVRVALRVRS